MNPSNRRRSLHIVRPHLAQGGADRVTISLLERLDRDLFDVTLVLFRREGPYLEEIPSDVHLEILGARSLWSAWLPLSRWIAKSSPDIVFSTCSGTNVAACLASLLSRKKHRLVLSERNVLVRDQPFAKRWLMLVAKRILYGFADSVTAVSKGVAVDLERKLGLDPRSIAVVYNPVATEDIGPLASESVDDRHFTDGLPVILAAGRLVAAKGFEVLIDAFSAIRHRTNASLVILGEGPLRRQLENHIDRLNLSDRVFLPGFTRNPFKHMARSTLFVLSSRFEGLPGVLIQAMACGAPVVSTNCNAGPAEIVTHGENGLLVPVDAPELLAREILRLLDDSDLRAQLSRAGRERSRDFRPEVVLPRYTRALLGSPSEPKTETVAT